MFFFFFREKKRDVLFFLFFREKKRDVLFFLFFQKKKRKNQRKETLSGRGMGANQRAALFYHLFSVYWAVHPPSSVTHFSLRGFSLKSPAKYFCGEGKCR